MLIPSLYISSDKADPWNPARAAGYGAAIGLSAGLFKVFGPSQQALSTWGGLLQIAGAVAGFALLCGGAALLRNFIVRRFVATSSM
jgi:hypothetical protein